MSTNVIAGASTSTPAGAAYVRKITHPPSVIPAEYLGTPDASAPNHIPVEVKTVANVPPIVTLPTGVATTQTFNPSSMLFISTSGCVASNLVFMRQADSWVQPQNQTASASQPAISQAVPPATANAAYNYNNFADDFSSFRTVYKSNTYYLNGTNFNNAGDVTTAKFVPDTYATDALSELERMDDEKSRNSLLLALKAMRHATSSKTDRGTEVADDFVKLEIQDPKLSVNKNAQLLQRLGIEPRTPIQVWELPAPPGASITPVANSNTMSYIKGVLPNTGSDLLTFSSKASTRLARDGSFVVHQKTDDISPWTVVNNQAAAVASFYTGLPNCFMRISSGSTYQFCPLFTIQSAASTTSPNSCETIWNNLDWSMTLFEGLSVPATTSTSLSGVPYITVKSYTGFEGRPQPNSTLRSFQKALPPPDRLAMDMATTIFHERPDSLPAAANDWGTIAKVALGAIPSLVPILTSIFGKKKVATAANSAATTASKVAGFVNKHSKTAQRFAEYVRKGTAPYAAGGRGANQNVANLNTQAPRNRNNKQVVVRDIQVYKPTRRPPPPPRQPPSPQRAQIPKGSRHRRGPIITELA